MATPMIIPDTEHLDASGKAMYKKWIYWIASACALGAAFALLAGILGLTGGNNWLITIFRLLAGSNGAQLSQLYQLNSPDLVLLALVATTFIGLYLALHKTHPILAAIAAVQPPLGILLFLLTQNAGRSAVMGAGLAISLAMLRGDSFTKWISRVGLVSSVLLFAGDLGTGLAPNRILAVSTGIGYVLLTGWLFAVAHRLFRLAR